MTHICVRNLGHRWFKYWFDLKCLPETRLSQFIILVFCLYGFHVRLSWPEYGFQERSSWHEMLARHTTIPVYYTGLLFFRDPSAVILTWNACQFHTMTTDQKRIYSALKLYDINDMAIHWNTFLLCSLTDDKPLFEPMLEFCFLDHWEQI